MSFNEIRAIGDTQSSVSESLHLQELHKHAQQDEEYRLLCTFILNGFPKQCKQLPEYCMWYWNVHQQLTVDDDLIQYGCRLLIPTKMRHQVLANLHEAHKRALRPKQRARLTIDWPCIDNDIDNIILNCQQCQNHLLSNVNEPIIQKSQPLRKLQWTCALMLAIVTWVHRLCSAILIAL